MRSASGWRPIPNSNSICRSVTVSPAVSPSADRPRPIHTPGGRPAFFRVSFTG